MNKRKGFTLIEIIVSIAIIGIIAVTMLTVFNTGLINIVRAGVRTDTVNKAEEDFLETPTVVDTLPIEIVLPIEGGSKTIEVNGSYAKGIIIANEGESSEVEVEIKAYIPGLVETE